jgi:hypothetical protein
VQKVRHDDILKEIEEDTLNKRIFEIKQRETQLKALKQQM